MNNLLKATDYILKFGILIGLLLRVFQFFFNRALWYDEAALAVNIINRDFSQLLQPLDYNQIAPVLFLWGQKLMTLLFGQTDWSLRIIPVLVGISCIWLTFKLGKLVFNEKIGLLASLIISLSHPLIYYSTESKPYILDQFFFLLITLLFITFLKNRNGQSLFHLCVVGILGISFSFPIIFLLFSIGIILLPDLVKNETKLKFNLVFVLSSWALLFAFLNIFLFGEHGSDGKMNTFWASHFAPYSGELITTLTWYPSHYAQIFYTIIGFPKFFAIIPILFSVLGLFAFLKEEKQITLAFLLPIIIHLVISGLHLYPFVERLNLYMAPTFSFLIAIGIYKISNKLLLNISLIILVISLIFPITIKIPFQREEIKTPLEYLSKTIKDSEVIYVYYGSKPAFEFYKKHYFRNTNIQIEYGIESRDNLEFHKKQLINIKKLDWLIFSHIYTKEISEEKYILSIINDFNSRPTKEKSALNAALYKVGTN